MSKKTDLPSTSRHVKIFDEDWDFLDAHFGRLSRKPIGVSKAIRAIIHAYKNRMIANADATLMASEAHKLDQLGGTGQ